jgi:mono/diheme cytochrome c family protein
VRRPGQATLRWVRSACRCVLGAGLVVGSVSSCREQTSEDPPVALERNMYDTERYNPESYSQLFPDHRTMRTPVLGTISSDFFEDDPEIGTGLLADKSAYVMTVPDRLAKRLGGAAKVLARGQERFGIYCVPCHGQTGDGKGMVVCKRDAVTDPCQPRGFPPLPSYEDARIRQMPDGQMFATITHGVRTMPAYGAQIPVADRWSIVTYVRALEVSQMAAATPSQPEPSK